MKHWAALTVLLYAVVLLLLTVPVLLIAFGQWWSPQGNGIAPHNAWEIYSSYGYWIWLAVLLAGQALLLLLPLRIAERRLPARRPLKVPVLVTAFLLANLVFAGCLSIFCAAFKEEGFGIFGFLTPFKADQISPSDLETLTGAIITVLTFWFIWAVIFRNYARVDDPDSLLKRITRWLLTASILELLVAVPSHVVTRRREDCCAPFGTFWGIATGISIMLLCFGPGVFFLFVERCRRLQPPVPEKNESRPE